MIEDIFKENPNVLPSIGLVKKIDFFIRGVPFDLKVTYLPEGYVKDRRKASKLRPELTLLKQVARKVQIETDTSLSSSDLLEHLWRMVADHPNERCRELIDELRNFRLDLITEIRNDPKTLIVWLYENQGERRFDSANRLFLILINQNNFFESWKLKRNRQLMAEVIESYLNDDDNAGQKIEFQWNGATYKTVADVVLVTHRQSA